MGIRQHAVVSFSRDVLHVLTFRLACNGLFSTLSVMIYCTRMGFRSEGEKSPTVDLFHRLSSYFLTQFPDMHSRETFVNARHRE